MNIKCIHKNKKLQSYQKVYKETNKNPPLQLCPQQPNPLPCQQPEYLYCMIFFCIAVALIFLTSSLLLDILVISRICKYRQNCQEQPVLFFPQGKLPEVERHRYFTYRYMLLNNPPESSCQYLFLLNWKYLLVVFLPWLVSSAVSLWIVLSICISSVNCLFLFFEKEGFLCSSSEFPNRGGMLAETGVLWGDSRSLSLSKERPGEMSTAWTYGWRQSTQFP